MNKTVKIILIVVVVLVLIFAGLVYIGWRYAGNLLEEGPEAIAEMFGEYAEDVPIEEVPVDEIEEEEDLTPEDPEPTETEENPYHLEEEITPMTDRNIAVNENIKRVMEEVFEEDPKLIETAAYYDLTYITNRVITEEDVQKVRDVFTESGFEMEEETLEVELDDMSADAESYSLNFIVKEEEEEDELRMIFFTTEEGDDTQLIKIRL